MATSRFGKLSASVRVLNVKKSVPTLRMERCASTSFDQNNSFPVEVREFQRQLVQISYQDWTVPDAAKFLFSGLRFNLGLCRAEHKVQYHRLTRWRGVILVTGTRILRWNYLLVSANYLRPARVNPWKRITHGFLLPARKPQAGGTPCRRRRRLARPRGAESDMPAKLSVNAQRTRAPRAREAREFPRSHVSPAAFLACPAGWDTELAGDPNRLPGFASFC
jgi:hypothetical protein